MKGLLSDGHCEMENSEAADVPSRTEGPAEGGKISLLGGDEHIDPGVLRMGSWNLQKFDRFKLNDIRVQELICRVFEENQLQVLFVQELTVVGGGYDGFLEPLTKALSGITKRYKAITCGVNGREGMGVVWDSLAVSVDLLDVIAAGNGHMRGTALFGVKPKDGGQFCAASVHLASSNAVSTNASDQLARLISDPDHRDDYDFILGDFNHSPQAEGWKSVFNVPTSVGGKQLDNFMFRTGGLWPEGKVVGANWCRTSDMHLISDHYPILITVQYHRTVRDTLQSARNANKLLGELKVDELVFRDFVETLERYMA